MNNTLHGGEDGLDGNNYDMDMYAKKKLGADQY